MCRSIKQLYNFEPPASDDEVRMSAVQFVRKVSGFSKPSNKNQVAMDQAVNEVARTIKNLLNNLETSAKPKNREIEAQKAKNRSAKRYSS
jgi:hypothetical protein